jgi:uncharacterized protein YcgI (DUF1989 family)
MRDPESIAQVFRVTSPRGATQVVDLLTSYAERVRKRGSARLNGGSGSEYNWVSDILTGHSSPDEKTTLESQRSTQWPYCPPRR